jgi:AraC-like DNA-binding protein
MEGETVDLLASRLGLGSRQLRRLFVRHLGFARGLGPYRIPPRRNPPHVARNQPGASAAIVLARCTKSR